MLGYRFCPYTVRLCSYHDVPVRQYGAAGIITGVMAPRDYCLPPFIKIQPEQSDTFLPYCYIQPIALVRSSYKSGHLTLYNIEFTMGIKPKNVRLFAICQLSYFFHYNFSLSITYITSNQTSKIQTLQ